MSPLGQVLADNWPWLLGALLTAMLAYWWWDEREDAESAGETVDGITDRMESVTGGALSGFRALVVGLVGIGGTVAIEFMHLASDLNGLLGGVPFLVGYLLYGLLSWAGIEFGLATDTLGFAFLLILVIALMVWYGNREADSA
ncbi:hypothetical protein [Halarchaeum sp. P4]|uniref:hypothetical protein n=1 Tax=Halarchaeum sp. P4 TaxID=3421639 RepID=UPI003EBC306F